MLTLFQDFFPISYWVALGVDPVLIHSIRSRAIILNEQYIYFNYDNFNSHYLMDCHICQNMSASWADSDNK